MRIQSYRFGEIVIEGRKYRDDLMVFADRVRAGWWRKEGHLLQVVDLTEALAAEPRGARSPNLVLSRLQNRDWN